MWLRIEHQILNGMRGSELNIESSIGYLDLGVLCLLGPVRRVQFFAHNSQLWRFVCTMASCRLGVF